MKPEVKEIICSECNKEIILLIDGLNIFNGVGVAWRKIHYICSDCHTKILQDYIKKTRYGK